MNKKMKKIIEKIKKILKLHKKKIITIVAVLVVGVVIFVFQVEILYFINKDENKVGWITDIHAGANKKRAFVNEDGSDNTLYPKKYLKYFPVVLERMKRQGIGTVIATGDNTNITEYGYARELREMAEKSGVKVVWVRGNHDFLPGENKDVMSELGVRENFYVYDTEKTRIIVLDINFNGPALTDENIEWFKKKVEETDLPVIVAAHSPIFDYDAKSILPAYAKLGEVISASKKVKFVISGHTHKDAAGEKDGVIYRTAWPLTQKNHMGSYYLLDVEGKTIEHFENYLEE